MREPFIPVRPGPFPEDYAFEPVPGRTRHDGWTAERQRDFILAIARIGVVSAAAKSVGMSAKSAYALRKRAAADSGFAAAWDAAMQHGRSNALDHCIDRALNGVPVPVFYGGRQIGERRKYDDRLLIAALRATGWAGGKRARFNSDGT